MTGRPLVLVTHRCDAAQRAAYAERLGAACDLAFWTDAAPAERDALLARATAIASWIPDREFTDAQFAAMRGLRFLQTLAAGTDRMPWAKIPDRVAVAHNAGVAAPVIAEHVLAFALAAAKELVRRHRRMAEGHFDQLAPTRRLAGMTAGIFGYGGIGRHSARLFKAFGLRVLAVNRSGGPDAHADFLGTLADRGRLLAEADIVVLALSLNEATRGIVGAAELSAMKPDAVLINVARAELIDEAALFRHLERNPGFTACLDPWWIEPISHGKWSLSHPFLELPNVIASPHCSGNTHGIFVELARAAAENIGRFLAGRPDVRLVPAADRRPAGRVSP